MHLVFPTCVKGLRTLLGGELIFPGQDTVRWECTPGQQNWPEFQDINRKKSLFWWQSPQHRNCIWHLLRTSSFYGEIDFIFFFLIPDSGWKFTTSGNVWPCRSDAWGGPSVCPMLPVLSCNGLERNWPYTATSEEAIIRHKTLICNQNLMMAEPGTGRDRSLLWDKKILDRVMPNGRPRYSNLWAGWGFNRTSAGYWLT